MKKVGIITIFDMDNYGNRLQNYALEVILRKLGVDAYSIIKLNKKGLLASMIESYKEYSFKEFLHFVKFMRFTFKFTHIDCVENADKYDLFVLGSDQIWNIEFAGSPFYFGDFTSKKKIAYAASFGVLEIEKEYVDYYREHLSEIDLISVREESAKKIIKEVINAETEVLIDPTLMLDKQEWMKISEKPKYRVPQKYVLTFFLGEADMVVKKYTDELNKMYGIELVDMQYASDIWYKTSPNNFLWLIEHSELVLTDSFHGTVFSMIMEKKFLVFERKYKEKSMGSRIETLLKKFGLEERKYSVQSVEAINNQQKVDISSQLQKERERAILFLMKAIGF